MGHPRDELGNPAPASVQVLAEVLAASRRQRTAFGVSAARRILHHHVPLALDLDRVERGVLRRVGQDVQRGVGAPRQQTW